MKAANWGPDIWDEKNRAQGDIGVILGTGFNRRSLEKNTAFTLSLARSLMFDRLPAGADVLDVGIGPSARFSIAMTELGFQVTGLDGSEEALRRASVQLKNSSTQAALVHADIANFSIDKRFDALFCVETFFHLPGHLAMNAFTSFNRALKPGGKALVQFAVLNEMTPSFLLKAFFYISAYKILSPLLKRLGRKSFYVVVTRHSEMEIRDLAERTGFTILESKQGYFLLEKSRELT